MKDRDEKYKVITISAYENIIKPYLDNIKKDDYYIKYVMYSIYIYIISSLIKENNFTKFFWSGIIWQSTFLLLHVKLHVDMLNQPWYEQKIMSYYHHYIDPLIYSKFPEHYISTNLFGLLSVLPYIYVDSTLASGIFMYGILDIYTHKWYHTPKKNRKKDFNHLYNLFILLEKIKILDTKKHYKIHHNCNNYVTKVSGWMDINLYLFENIHNFIGDKLFNFISKYHNIITIKIPYILLFILYIFVYKNFGKYYYINNNNIPIIPIILTYFYFFYKRYQKLHTLLLNYHNFNFVK